MPGLIDDRALLLDNESCASDTVAGMVDMLRFYATPGTATAIADRVDLTRELPAEPASLAEVVRGLVVHNYEVEKDGLAIGAERMAHMQSAVAQEVLDNVIAIDSSPLATKRSEQDRMVGFCYHFALLHCALLRNAGIPARARCGFASYLGGNLWIDHWVSEYWDQTHWHLCDPQLARDRLDGTEFQTAITAWISARSSQTEARLYGNGKFWGWDELRGSLINDVGALNKVEISGWYWCAPLQIEPLDAPCEEIDGTLDILAERTRAARTVEELSTAYDRYPELRPPPGARAR